MIHRLRATGLGQRSSRRRFVRTAFGTGIGVALGPTAIRRPATANDRPTLRMLCWPGYNDPKVTAPFRERHGVEIEARHIGANDEIFTFLRAGGIGRYDLVTPHNGVVRPLVDVGLIQPLNETLLPNAADYIPRFRWPDWVVVDGQIYGAPFLWGTSPMVYAAKYVPEPPAAWLEVQEPRFQGKVVMTEDGLGHFLTWNWVMGYADPTRVTLAQLNATTQLLISIKREQAVVFAATMNGVASTLASGRGWVTTIGWEATPSLPGARGADLRITHPLPGDYSFCDNLCLATGAPNPELAHAFIDHMLAPATQATLMNRLKRGTVNARAIELLDPDTRALYTYDDLDAVFARSPLRGFPPLSNAGDGIATYVDWVKAWERVRVTEMRAAADS